MVPQEKLTEELLKFSIINIDKPSGPTSFQISQFIKNSLKINKTSHFGTLDPQVSGVLPVALGRACRLNEYFMHRDKIYMGIMRLHKDIEDKVLHEVMKKFIGKIIQLPPVRSRVKRAPREREVKKFQIIEREEKDILFETQVQAGTYIRKICLHPDTEVLTSSGLIKMSNIVSSQNRVYSLDDKTLVKKNISAFQKINSPKNLIKIKMESGIDILATSDHKFLISINEGYKMVECGDIKEGDYLVKMPQPPFPDREYIVSDFLDDDYLIEQPEIKEECKRAFIERFSSIREMNRKLKLDRKNFLENSKNAISVKHLKLAGIYNSVKTKLFRFKTPKGKIIELDKLNEDHFYLLGLIASDGNNTREKKTKRFTRLKFHNENESLVNCFLSTYKKLFPTVPISKRKIDTNFFQLDTSNSLFASIAAGLGIISPNTRSDILPILYANNRCIRSFLRGYFDGDGTAHYKIKSRVKGIYSIISFFSINYANAKRLHQMLLKLGISNKIFRLKNGMNVVSLTDIASKKKFIREIGTNHPIKQKNFEKINSMEYRNESEDEYHIGFHYKKFIKENKSKLYKMGGNLTRILNTNVPITKNFYKKCTQLANLPNIDELIIERVRKIEEIASPEFVFDISVPETHNFLIETGFISSNCDDIGREIGGAHMLELRRTKASIFSEKDSINLYDFEKAIEEYKKGNEELLRKILIPAEEAIIKVMPQIKIKESSVKQLLTGKPLMKIDLRDKIPPEEVFAAFYNNQFIAIYKKTNESQILARPEFVYN